MKKTTLIGFLLSLAIYFQPQNLKAQEDAISSFNGFQRTKSKYPDSAVTYLKYLVALKTRSASDLIHNSFAQSFLNIFSEKMTRDTAFLAMLKQRNLTLDSVLAQINEDKKNANIILSKLENDQNPFLKDNIYPISQWVQAQQNKADADKLAEIANSYVEYLSNSKNFYDGRKARYGLLLLQLLNTHEKLKPVSNKIVQVIYKGLKEQQVIETSNDTRDLTESRAWYRYLFAYTNFILAQNSAQKEKIEYLKTAYQYSPDNLDKTVSSAYFYDMVFLFGEERKSFEEDYLAVLGSDEEKYNELLKMSMNNPSFKSKAKALSKNRSEFDDIWLTEFNKTFKTAPLFSLPQIDKSIYALGITNKNQWTLIDFWGTWCGPCRKEHPDLEKLYQRTKNGQMTKLNIITIASRDREIAVKDYMQQFNYNFPVIMSDNKIEQLYNVSSWPSKFLVSPQGKFVIIPFNVDWVKYIEDYLN